MPDVRRPSSQFASDLQPKQVCVLPVVTEFYREEFVKHRECLERQRECFSAQAFMEVDAALTRIISQLDNFCQKQNADQVLGKLLRKFDIFTRLSAWTDPKHVH